MKKVICLLLAMMLCVGMALPALAVDDGFVPSVSYDPNPGIVPGVDPEGNDYIGIVYDENGDIIEYIERGCLLITPIAYLWDDTKVVSDEIRELLTYIHQGLEDETMVLPYELFEQKLYEANMAVIDIYDLRWTCEEHPIMLDPIGVVIDLTFDFNIDPNVELFVLAYDKDNDEWAPIVETVNNGDGTITCTLEELAPLAFTVKVDAVDDGAVETEAIPETGSNSVVWVVGLAVIVICSAVVVVLKNKKGKA